MGNRAVIEFQNEGISTGLGIYLHWNGGRDSVESFLGVAKDYGLDTSDYGIARIAQLIGNFFGGKLSIGLHHLTMLDCDNFDNGVYIVDENLDIVDRKHLRNQEQQNVYDIEDMKREIHAINDPIFYRKEE